MQYVKAYMKKISRYHNIIKGACKKRKLISVVAERLIVSYVSQDKKYNNVNHRNQK